MAQECNVKQVDVSDSSENFCTVETTPDFAKLGPKFRAQAPRIAAMLRRGDFVRAGDNYLVAGHLIDASDVQRRTRAVPGFAVTEANGWVVALDTTVSAQLEREGRARDLIRHIQQARKDAHLSVTDRIHVVVPRHAADLLDDFLDGIAHETLAISITVGNELEILGAQAP